MIQLSFSTGTYVRMDGVKMIGMEQIWTCHKSQPHFGVESSISANYVS